MILMLGLRLVWTVHNILPHEPIFDDDEMARRMLIRRADAVIALNEYGRQEIKKKFATDVTAVIPPGVTVVGNPLGRNLARETSKLDQNLTTVIFVGRLARYKGVDVLLKALAVPIPKLALRIAGECRDAVYAEGAHCCDAPITGAGSDVLLELRPLSEEEYSAYLSRADFAIFPFRSVTNSETVMTALSFGLPVLIPALDALSEFPEGAVRKWKFDDGCASIRAVLQEATSIDKRERDKMRSAALLWADTRSWRASGNATQRVYEQILAEGAQ